MKQINFIFKVSLNAFVIQLTDRTTLHASGLFSWTSLVDFKEQRRLKISSKMVNGFLHKLFKLSMLDQFSNLGFSFLSPVEWLHSGDVTSQKDFTCRFQRVACLALCLLPASKTKRLQFLALLGRGRPGFYCGAVARCFQSNSQWCQKCVRWLISSVAYFSSWINVYYFRETYLPWFCKLLEMEFNRAVRTDWLYDGNWVNKNKKSIQKSPFQNKSSIDKKKWSYTISDWLALLHTDLWEFRFDRLPNYRTYYNAYCTTPFCRIDSRVESGNLANKCLHAYKQECKMNIQIWVHVYYWVQKVTLVQGNNFIYMN